MQRYSEYKDSGVQWLGEIPSHWEVRKMKFTFQERSKKGYPLLPLLAATQNHGVIRKENYENRTVEATKGLETLKLVEEGDFVISLRSFQGGIEICHEKGIISPAYTILRPTNIGKRYFKHLGKSPIFIQLLKSMVTGIREGQNIDYGKLRDNLLPIPSVNEQETIANYLDSVTAKIDTAIAQQQKMIDLLNERKQIIINNAVTKGLNPNVKMKDSGVEWIGEIPEHWEVIRIKHLLRESKIRSMRGKEEPLSMSQSYGLIPTKNMETIPNMASSYAGAKIVKKGNLVFNKLKAHLGVFNVSKYDGLVSPDYAVYSSLGKVNLRFLEYLFKTPKCIHEFVKLITGVGAGLSRLYTSDLFSIYCAIPSLEEQNSICSYIQNRTLKIDESIMLYRKQISLLQERKQIIINDVVTGKVKVV